MNTFGGLRLPAAGRVGRGKTFYGAAEIGVRDPAGNVLTFAHFAERH